ncbi:hypothetical protein LSH36_807g00141 [Paralvinella palmiformis]|uniref:F5/8 type C domain-containing protein n=1 Tax=Paralvinella palmiformis TaxID=53620 RepID=A0AAD9MUW3_9ANNE|nr:hypothetical protein LSH36_807g00141 [Paralvinella palmiformis]
MDKAPDISSWIRPLSVVSILQTCLIRCSVTPECKAVLYENSKCYLYSTSDGSSVLIFGQQAVSVVSRKSIYGNAPQINIVQLNNIVSCSASAKYLSHTCYNMIDGVLTTFWMTNTTNLYQWIRLEFAQYYEVHAVDLWSRARTKGQCSRLSLNFSNNFIRQVDRKCVTTDRPAYNRFEIDGVLSDYVKMTCIDRCLPSGWFVHFEMAVFVRV